MSDTTIFGRAALDRLSALEIALSGSASVSADITNFEKALLARIAALEIQKFGKVSVEPDTTSFTVAVLARLSALEGGGGVSVAPVLSSPTALSTGSTTASLGVTTDTGNGTLYWVVSTSATPPSKSQVAAGQDSTGSAAAASSSQAVGAPGVQSVSATGLTPSTTYYPYFMQVGSNTLQSNVAAAASFATSAPAAITAPTYALSTASGVSPASWNVGGDSTFQPGMFVHQQFAVSGTNFATPVPGASTVDYFTQIEGSDWEANSSTIGNGMAAFVQPTNAYDTRCRFETSPGDSTNNVTSAWSNTVTDTISTATAILSATDVSPYLTRLNNYQARSNSGGNFMQLVRANVQQANQKAHWEVSIDKFANEASPAGSISINLMDSSGNEALPVGGNPGQVPIGYSFMVTRGSTTATLFRNGGGDTSHTLSAVPAVGDTLSLDYDYTAHTMHARYKHVSGGTIDDLGTVTLTSLIPAVPFAAAGAYDYVDASNYDGFTFNPGNAAWAITPDTGFTFYA